MSEQNEGRIGSFSSANSANLIVFALSAYLFVENSKYFAEPGLPGLSLFESRQRSFQVCLAWGSFRENLEKYHMALSDWMPVGSYAKYRAGFFLLVDG